MGKWYDKIVIGNPNKEDFTAKDLPKTRVDQFLDVIKLRFGGLVTANLIVGLFGALLMLWMFFCWFTFTAMTKEEAVEWAQSADLWLIFFMVSIPLYTLMGPAMAGLYYCLRNWIWNRRATVGEHFWKEFKRSWKKAAFFNLFDSTLFFAGFWWLWRFSLVMDQQPIFKVLSIVIIMLISVYYMTSIYHFPQLVTYNLTIKQIFKNSFIYFVVQFPRTLAAVIIYLALIVLCVMLSQVFLVVAMSLGLAIVCLGNMILSDFMFDKYVNPPEERRKGMAPKE